MRKVRAADLHLPSVSAVNSPQRLIDLGLRGRVQSAPGLWLPFAITDWAPDRFWAWRVP